VAPFNQTCLPRLLPTKRRPLSLLIVGDVKTLHDVRSDNDWDDFLLEVHERRKRWMHQLWESRTDGEYTMHNDARF
jgi:hypothetical protein